MRLHQRRKIFRLLLWLDRKDFAVDPIGHMENQLHWLFYRYFLYHRDCLLLNDEKIISLLHAEVAEWDDLRRDIESRMKEDHDHG